MLKPCCMMRQIITGRLLFISTEANALAPLFPQPSVMIIWGTNTGKSLNRHYTPQLQKYKLVVGCRWTWRSCTFDVVMFLAVVVFPFSAQGAGIGDRASLSRSSQNHLPRELRRIIMRKYKGRTRRLRMMWVVCGIRFGISGSVY